MKRELWRVNSFTDRPYAGNPAGVVLDADGLDEQAMLAISTELNDLSETVFICTPDTPEADVRLRYFTTTAEVDLCGHATVAALFTLAWTGRAQASDGVRSVRAQTRVGILDLGMEFDDGRMHFAVMEQLAPQVAPAPGAGVAAQILGLPPTSVRRDSVVACASTGMWVCFVPLASLEALTTVRVQRERIAELWPENQALAGVYPFVLLQDNGPQAGRVHTQGRLFARPEIGIVEDPVTGTASGALGGYLMEYGLLAPTGELVARQGVEMGRAGQVWVRRNPNGRMVIRGQAAPIFRGELLTEV